jgi:hypothetical protein
MVRLSKAQRRAVFNVFQRDFPNWITPTKRLETYLGDRHVTRVSSIQYRRFRAKVQPAFGDTCVMLPWKGMWLGIERDGHTHS